MFLAYLIWNWHLQKHIYVKFLVIYHSGKFQPGENIYHCLIFIRIHDFIILSQGVSCMVMEVCLIVIFQKFVIVVPIPKGLLFCL